MTQEYSQPPREYRVCHIPYERDRSRQSSLGVLTIVSNQVNPGEYEYGVAVCSPGDNFSKRVGRHLAYKRLKSDDHVYRGYVEYHGKKRYIDIKVMIIVDILANKQLVLQEWALDALKSELLECMYNSFLGFNIKPIYKHRG